MLESGYRPGNKMVLIISLILAPTMQVHPLLLMGTGLSIFFGNGDLVSYLMNGSEEWRRNIQKDYGDFCFQWTFSSSPTLYQGETLSSRSSTRRADTWKGKCMERNRFYSA